MIIKHFIKLLTLLHIPNHNIPIIMSGTVKDGPFFHTSNKYICYQKKKKNYIFNVHNK